MSDEEEEGVSYDNDGYYSLFVGRRNPECDINEYLEIDYDEDEEVSFELGLDFGIDWYDEDFLFLNCLDEPSKDIAKVLTGEVRSDVVEAIEKMFPDGFPDAYDNMILIGHLKYEGETKDVVNPEFGAFKFIGCFEED
jgi:hypothetical protein